MLKFSFLFLAALSLSILAAPSTIQFQSSLHALDGAPVSGVTAISFALYAGESEPQALWAEQQSPLVEDGHYSIQLGSQQPFPPGLFAADQLWLGISIDGDELLPRTRLLAVPYALLAKDVEAGAIRSDSLADDVIQSRHLQAAAVTRRSPCELRNHRAQARRRQRLCTDPPRQRGYPGCDLRK